VTTNSNTRPFDESRLNDIIIRRFLPTVDESELKWHWDEQERIIEPLNQNDWMFQFDNGLPFPIREKINIPAGVIHRVIKGSTDLVIKIKMI
jgi:hypothetical protein